MAGSHVTPPAPLTPETVIYHKLRSGELKSFFHRPGKAMEVADKILLDRSTLVGRKLAGEAHLGDRTGGAPEEMKAACQPLLYKGGDDF